MADESIMYVCFNVHWITAARCVNLKLECNKTLLCINLIVFPCCLKSFGKLFFFGGVQEICLHGLHHMHHVHVMSCPVCVCFHVNFMCGSHTSVTIECAVACVWLLLFWCYLRWRCNERVVRLSKLESVMLMYRCLREMCMFLVTQEKSWKNVAWEQSVCTVAWGFNQWQYLVAWDMCCCSREMCIYSCKRQKFLYCCLKKMCCFQPNYMYFQPNYM